MVFSFGCAVGLSYVKAKTNLSGLFRDDDQRAHSWRGALSLFDNVLVLEAFEFCLHIFADVERNPAVRLKLWRNGFIDVQLHRFVSYYGDVCEKVGKISAYVAVWVHQDGLREGQKSQCLGGLETQ